MYCNVIIKWIKNKKYVIAKHFSEAKTADMSHHKKHTEERSPSEIIIHIGSNNNGYK